MLILVPTAPEAQSLFDEAAPTSEIAVDTVLSGVRVRAALCGFGPVAAAALSSITLAAERPEACLHVGIAGTFQPDVLPVGGVIRPAEVRLMGVGRGQGARFEGPRELGMAQAPEGPDGEAVYDTLPLAGAETGGVLLTVATAAATSEHAAARLRRHPDVLAEDMESFGVALACRRLGVPLTVVRAVSNVVGEPDRGRWDVSTALDALREHLVRMLAS